MATDPRQINKTFTLMGSSFIPGAGALIDKLRSGQMLALTREPTNTHDSNAIMVKWGNKSLGYLPRQLAAEIAPLMDAGLNVIVRKAPPLAGFGAYRGILELAYVPPEETPSPAGNERQRGVGSVATTPQKESSNDEHDDDRADEPVADDADESSAGDDSEPTTRFRRDRW